MKRDALDIFVEVTAKSPLFWVLNPGTEDYYQNSQ